MSTSPTSLAAPSLATGDVARFAHETYEAGVRSPFSADVLATLGALSKDLLTLKGAPPAFTALGYWLRPAALAEYRKEFEAGLPVGTLAVPRGLTLHLPPTNVDTIFVYSWALSLLVGNANIVRLPSQQTAATRALMDIVTKALTLGNLSSGNAFVSYSSEGPMTAKLCAVCDTRAIWGGDAKVALVQSYPMRPGGVTVPFPDRYSYSVIDCAAYSILDDAGRDALATRAFNDIFLFDQLACSSSRVVFWRGTADNWRRDAEDFSDRCSKVARQRGYEVAASTRINKFVYALRIAIDSMAERADFSDTRLTSVYLDKSAPISRVIEGGGALVHKVIGSLESIASFVERQDQTMTYFGINRQELFEFVQRLRGRGIDRVVPIGHATLFDRIWDGFDLLRTFSKLVCLR